MNGITEAFKVKFSTGEDFDALYNFYNDEERRTENVYLRHADLIKSQAEKGRFVTVSYGGELVAASSLYTLANNKIDCVIHGNQFVESGRVVELGSVLRAGHNPNDIKIPHGIWRPILFGLPMIHALRFDEEFDILIAEVLHTGVDTKRYVTGDSSMGSCMNWTQIKPTVALKEACGMTTDDERINSGKDFFRASVPQNIVSVASALKKIIDTGYIVDTRPQGVIGYDPSMKVPIDLSALGIRSLLETIIANKHHIRRHFPHDISWAEASRQLANRTQRTEEPYCTRTPFVDANLLGLGKKDPGGHEIAA